MFKYLMFLFLAICSVSFADLHIVEQFSSTYYVEMHGFLIYDDAQQKYGYYITDYFSVSIPFNAEEIMSNHTPQTLDCAQKAWPQYNLNERYYFTQPL